MTNLELYEFHLEIFIGQGMPLDRAHVYALDATLAHPQLGEDPLPEDYAYGGTD